MANPSVADSSAHDNSKSEIHCDQCQMSSINGIPCHETGCPNSRKTWLPERTAWVLFVDCFECGYPVEVGEVCSCHEPIADTSEETEVR